MLPFTLQFLIAMIASAINERLRWKPSSVPKARPRTGEWCSQQEALPIEV